MPFDSSATTGNVRAWSADWIILSRNQELLKKLRDAKGNQSPEAPTPPFPVWTDGRHNLLEVLK